MQEILTSSQMAMYAHYFSLTCLGLLMGIITGNGFWKGISRPKEEISIPKPARTFDEALEIIKNQVNYGTDYDPKDVAFKPKRDAKGRFIK